MKSHSIIISLIVILLACSFADAKYSGGTGMPSDPYRIATPEDMQQIGANSGDWSKHFKLMADIDLSGYNGTSFNIIGRGTNLFDSFRGVFDGNGHKIYNFNYASGLANTVGIFGLVVSANAEIKNLGLITPNVNGDSDVGALVGELYAGTVSNCYVQSGHIQGDWSVGGIVGSIEDGTISGCSSNSQVTGTYDSTGGLVGLNYNGTISTCDSNSQVIQVTETVNGYVGGLVGENYGMISESHSTGTVEGVTNPGGLVGRNYGRIENCYSTCSVSGSEWGTGGLVGFNWDGTVSHCYSTGNVSGDRSVGGLVGDNDGNVFDCYSNSDVLGYWDVGGLAGRNTMMVTNSYATGNAYSPVDTCGGLIGWNYSSPWGDDGRIENCVWDVETSELSNMCGTAGGTGCDDSYGRITLEMKTKSTFTEAGWDFVEIWLINEGATYPVLRQEIRSDLNGDGGVDMLDFAVFADHWLEGKDE